MLLIAHQELIGLRLVRCVFLPHLATAKVIENRRQSSWWRCMEGAGEIVKAIVAVLPPEVLSFVPTSKDKEQHWRWCRAG